jgi:hypothetical protein
MTAPKPNEKGRTSARNSNATTGKIAWKPDREYGKTGWMHKANGGRPARTLRGTALERRASGLKYAAMTWPKCGSKSAKKRAQRGKALAMLPEKCASGSAGSIEPLTS